MIQTVARATELLQHLAVRPMSLGDLSDVLDVHKSTVLRLLQTLEAESIVRRDRQGRYVLGFGLIRLAESALEQIDIRTVAHPHLTSLAARLGHTVHLAQYLDGRIIYVDKVEGRGTVAMGSRIGLPTDLHTAAVAKAILSHLPAGERSRVLEEQASFVRYSATTITDLPRYLGELDRTRQRGWAEDDGEKEDYINCVAVPIRDATGRVTAGLSVTALRAVAPLETLRTAVPAIRTVSAAISSELGWRPPAGRGD